MWVLLFHLTEQILYLKKKKKISPDGYQRGKQTANREISCLFLL